MPDVADSENLNNGHNHIPNDPVENVDDNSVGDIDELDIHLRSCTRYLFDEYVLLTNGGKHECYKETMKSEHYIYPHAIFDLMGVFAQYVLFATYSFVLRFWINFTQFLLILWAFIWYTQNFIFSSIWLACLYLLWVFEYYCFWWFPLLRASRIFTFDIFLVELFTILINIFYSGVFFNCFVIFLSLKLGFFYIKNYCFSFAFVYLFSALLKYHFIRDIFGLLHITLLTRSFKR